MNNPKILRLLDANLNRTLEGLRVCEEIMRFVICEKSITLEFKNIRHKTTRLIKDWGIDKKLLLNSRDTENDIGKNSTKSELTRTDYKNIFFANIQRAKESLRVLEEFSKLDNKKISGGFKVVRYNLYRLESKAYTRL